MASRAFDWLVLRLVLDAYISKAIDVHLVEALCRLKECNVTLLLVCVCDLFVAELAHPLLRFLLHVGVVSVCSLALAWVHESSEVHIEVRRLVRLYWRPSAVDLVNILHFLLFFGMPVLP